MARKRKKQPEPAPTNKRWTLDNIEEEARATGCEVLFGPQRVKLVRTVVEYAPYRCLTPGRSST